VQLTVFVALLRGINVGKAKRLQMAALRALLAELGYEQVQTLLNSGNAIFHARAGTESSHAKAIAVAIQNRMSFEVPVIVKCAKNLALIVGENPYAQESNDHSKLMVAFAPDQRTLKGLSSIQSLVVPSETFAVGRNAAYLHCADSILKSKAAVALLGKTGQGVTTRNWSTTLKLHAMATDEAVH